VISNASWLVMVVVSCLSLALVDVVTSVLLAVLVGASISRMALVDIVAIGVRWAMAISISWLSISLSLSLSLVHRLGWVSKDSPSNVRSSTMGMVSKGTRVFHLSGSVIHLGWSMLHFHGLVMVVVSCLSLALMDVVTSVLLTVLVGASMSRMALVDIVAIGIRWVAIGSVSWLSLSLALVDVVTSILLTVLVGASISRMALVDIVTIGVRWAMAISVSWFSIGLSFSLVDVMPAVSM